MNISLEKSDQDDMPAGSNLEVQLDQATKHVAQDACVVPHVPLRQRFERVIRGRQLGCLGLAAVLCTTLAVVGS